MKTQLGLCAAFALLLSLDAAAQNTTPSQPAAQPQTTTPPQTSAQPAVKPGEVTVIGCLLRESDFRAIQGSGRGGVLGTGVGTGNEYVLSDAVPADTNRNSRMRPRAAAQGDASAVGTSGGGRHYSLTGTLEENLLRDVGRLVEIVGTVDEPKQSGTLPRLTIDVWHPVGDFCPATH